MPPIHTTITTQQAASSPRPGLQARSRSAGHRGIPIPSQSRSMAPPHQSDTCGSEAAPAVVTTVDVMAARDLISSPGGHRYLDVRTEEELAKLGHLLEPHSSLNVPYMFITPQGSRVKNGQFVEQVASLLSNKEEPVLVGCQSGKRSELACIDLQAAGFKNVKNMGGGYLAWVHHGFPVHYHVPSDMEGPPPTPTSATQA